MKPFQFLAAAAAIALAAPAFAHDGVEVRDSYIRATTPQSPTAAAFMEIDNHQQADDLLLFATSDIAERVELHTHVEDADGVMRMVHVFEGFPIAAHACLALRRGGHHIMFLGLNRPLVDGDIVRVTLHFERSGTVDLDIVVDSARTDDQNGHGGGTMCAYQGHH